MAKRSLVVLITGCSSGFGLLTAARLAVAGHRVHATVRDCKKAEFLEAEVSRRGAIKNLRIHHLDVTDALLVKSVVTEVTAEEGVIDVLINNAGYGIGGFFEDLTDTEIRQQFDTNFFGVLNMTRAVLPVMRPRRSGRIINVSSVSAFSGSPTFSAYASSKWALEGFSECLYMELKPFNVDVVLVEPGSYRTKIFTDNARYAQTFNDAQSPYYETGQLIKKFVGQHVRASRRDPEDVAAYVQYLVETPRPRFRNIIGLQSKLRCWAVRHLPFEFYAWIVSKLLSPRKGPHA